MNEVTDGLMGDKAHTNNKMLGKTKMGRDCVHLRALQYAVAVQTANVTLALKRTTQKQLKWT